MFILVFGETKWALALGAHFSLFAKSGITLFVQIVWTWGVTRQIYRQPGPSHP